MKLIIGLGNPGAQYALTRHNAGFLALDSFVEHTTEGTGTVIKGWTADKHMQAEVMKLSLGNNGDESSLLLAKPQTFMNNSGDAAQALLQYYKIPLHDLLVLFDDIDLPLGTIRYRSTGSSGGHKGMQSLIERLGTTEIRRIRIGINQEARRAPTDAFVLQRFEATEQEALKQIFTSVTTAIEEKFLK